MNSGLSNLSPRFKYMRWHNWRLSFNRMPPITINLFLCLFSKLIFNFSLHLIINKDTHIHFWLSLYRLWSAKRNCRILNKTHRPRSDLLYLWNVFGSIGLEYWILFLLLFLLWTVGLVDYIANNTNWLVFLL